jgi:hypothetical protein
VEDPPPRASTVEPRFIDTPFPKFNPCAVPLKTQVLNPLRAPEFDNAPESPDVNAAPPSAPFIPQRAASRVSNNTARLTLNF